MVTIWLHTKANRRNRMLMKVTLGLYLCSNVLSLLAQVFRNITFRGGRIQVGRLTSVTRIGESLVLGITLPVKWTFLPGQHIHLTFLTLRHWSFAQRHPFTLAWWENAATDSSMQVVYVVIQPRKGWTRQLLDICQHQSRQQHNLEGEIDPNTSVWLGGPFGQAYNLEDYSFIILFATGNGIVAQMPLLKAFASRGIGHQQKIRLIWDTKSVHDLAQQWLNDILGDPNMPKDADVSYAIECILVSG